MRQLQERIIRELGVKPDIDPAAEFEDRTKFLAWYLERSAANGFVLGISGGQDSLLAGMLAQKATERLRQDGRDVKFHAMLLPYGLQLDRSDALLAIETIRPDIVHDFNINAATDALAGTFEQTEGEPLADYHKGNVKARMRMVAQYAIAGQQNLLVIGTDHAAEAITGFYTKFGDGAADVVPLNGLNKRQGRQILEYLQVPAQLLSKVPTADLLDNKPGQSDETELGISYSTIDDYLEGRDIDPTAAEKLEARFIATAHKRNMPVAYI